MNRRTFIRTSAAAVTVGGVASSLGAQDAKGAKEKSKTDATTCDSCGATEKKLEKAVKFGMVRTKGTVKDKFALVKRLGYDGIELDAPSGLKRDEVLRARDEVELEIHGVVDSVHWRTTLGDPDPNVRAKGREALEVAIRDCKAYGGSTVLLVPAVVSGKIAYDEAYERSQKELRLVLPVAEAHGIKIAFENVWNNFLLSPLEAARYIDELESDHVGWYLDVGNLVNYGWPEQWVRILGKRILKLDIKEFSRKKRNDEGLWKGFGVEIGDGDCGWPKVMKALDEIGFTAGWATAEVGGGGEERLSDVKARMDRVLTFED